MITGIYHRDVKPSLPVSLQRQSSRRFSLHLWPSCTALRPEHCPFLVMIVRFLQSFATKI